MNESIIRINEPKVLDTKTKKKISVQLNVRRYITNINGTIVPDATVITDAPHMVKPYPFHFFGEFDKQGAYNISDRLLKGIENTNLFSIYIGGINTPLYYFNTLANIIGKIGKGDIAFVYADDLDAPNYLSWVIVSTPQGGYNSYVAQTHTSQLSGEFWGTFKMFELHMSWFDANDLQLQYLLYVINTTSDLMYSVNQIEPVKYYNPQFSRQKKVIINYEKVINQYTGISSFISFENPLLTFNIIVYV